MQKCSIENWDDLRLLLALSRTGSIARAAGALGINQTTVARRLDQCEASFGTRLFDRVRGAARPTEAGQELMAHAERIEREVLAAQAGLSGQNRKVEGTVRLTSVPLVINHILIPALADLQHAHPNLRLELIAEPKDLSLTKREADFAVRLSRPSREAPVLAQKIGTLTYGVYGPAGLQGAPENWIVYDDTLAHLPHAKWLAGQSAPGTGTVAVNDAESVVACLRARLGASLLPVAIGEGLEGLARIPHAAEPPTREVWLLSHPDHKALLRMNVVADWIKQAVRKALA